MPYTLIGTLVALALSGYFVLMADASWRGKALVAATMLASIAMLQAVVAIGLLSHAKSNR